MRFARRGALRLKSWFEQSLTTADSLLAQVFSQNWLKHDSVVVQLDEFQGALQRWEEQPSAAGITHQGLCEILQGSTFSLALVNRDDV